MPAFTYGLYCFAVLAGFLISSNVSANDLLALKEQAWLSADITNDHKLLALTTAPIECVNPNAPAISTLGRLAFESSALLGGQAARMGLSCASCHPSGRTNPNFFLKNISTTPGSADVTHGFFSSTGGNNTLTPVMIPDLAKPNQSKIKNRWSDEFRNKLHQLITVEFDGQHAPTLIIDALQTYLANTDTRYCQETEEQLIPIRLSGDLHRLEENIDSLTNYPEKNVNQLLIRIARKRLETIYLRYTNLENQKPSTDLITFSRQLEELSLSKIGHKEQIQSLKRWRKQTNKLFAALKQYEALSMYNPSVITKLIHQQEQALEQQ